MAKSNVKQALKKLAPSLLDARDRNLNEADTRIRVVRLLADVLGYNEFNEITGEQRIRDRFVDFAVSIDGVVKFLVEIKAATKTLRDRYIEQAQRYASEGNIRWVLLTNGVVWNLYHLTFEEGIDYSKAYSVDLASDSVDSAADLLGLLERKSVLKGGLEKYWEKRQALSPLSRGRALFTTDVLRLVRREVRRNEGFQIDVEDLAEAIHKLFSTEAREQMGPYRIRTPRKSTRSPRKRKAPSDETPMGPSEVAQPPSEKGSSPDAGSEDREGAES